MVSPVLERILREWLQHDSTHVITAEGATGTVSQTVCLDGGCPLIPGLPPVGIAPALLAAQSSRQELDSDEVSLVFLDDTYLLGVAEALTRGRETIELGCIEVRQQNWGSRTLDTREHTGGGTPGVTRTGDTAGTSPGVAC